MTPRKELYIKIKEALESIPELEYIDWDRRQFDDPEDNYPDIYTAALININSIRYETMTQNLQEGETSIDVTLYCKDGFADQHNNTADPEHGLIEIDLLDSITEKLQFLKGEYFKPLQLENEETEREYSGIMSYKLTFSTLIYRKLNTIL